MKIDLQNIQIYTLFHGIFLQIRIFVCILCLTPIII